MNLEILRLDKYFSYGTLWPQKARWGAIDVYSTKPLRALNETQSHQPQHQSLDYIHVVATQLPVMRNPLAPVHITEAGGELEAGGKREQWK